MKDFFNRLFCTHDYEIINKFVVPSRFDIIVESGYTPKTYSDTTRKHITDFKCTICKKHKRLTIKTY